MYKCNEKKRKEWERYSYPQEEFQQAGNRVDNDKDSVAAAASAEVSELAGSNIGVNCAKLRAPVIRERPEDIASTLPLPPNNNKVIKRAPVIVTLDSNLHTC